MWAMRPSGGGRSLVEVRSAGLSELHSSKHGGSLHSFRIRQLKGLVRVERWPSH